LRYGYILLVEAGPLDNLTLPVCAVSMRQQGVMRVDR
jgi:hypothetical protein